MPAGAARVDGQDPPTGGTVSWHEGPILAFDTETTSRRPREARIVQAAVARCEPHRDNDVRTWLLDPGVEVPEEAAAIHGITTEVARRDGEQPTAALGVIADALVAAWREGLPTVVMNAPYDLTVLDAELVRHGLADLDARRGTVPMLLVDPLVIDRHLDRYRKGKKRLEDLCRVYGVALDDAHTADADALATARVAWRLAERYPDELADLVALQERQAQWHRAWAEDFEAYLREHVDPTAEIGRSWPRHPRPDEDPG